MSKIRRLRNNRKGAAAVEFALVLPVLLAVFFCIFEMGWLLSSQTVLNHATFQAARTASKAINAGQETTEAAQLARERAVDTYWMGTLYPEDVIVDFETSGDVPQVEVRITVDYVPLTGWFETGVVPAELYSKAVTPF
jgi:Flp pilus assembly protein TadG